MSNCSDDRETDADESSNPSDKAPSSEREDGFEDKQHNTTASTVKATATDQNAAAPSPQILPATANENENDNDNTIGNNTNDNSNNPSSEFIRQHGHYYQQQTSISPAPPALGYETSQGMLLQNLTPGGIPTRQQFLGAPPPPLSPGLQNGVADTNAANTTNTNTNNTNNNTNTSDEAQISLGVLAPSSPVFPAPSMAFVGTGGSTEPPQPPGQQHVDSARMTGGSLIAPASPSMQFMQGQPPSPLISGYGGVYGGYGTGSPGVGYGRQDVANSPDTRLSWPERVQQQTLYQTAPPSANSPHLQSQPIPIQFPGRRTTSFDEILSAPAIDDNGSYTAPNTIPTPGAIFSQQQAPWGYSLNNPYTTSPQQSQIQGHPPPQPTAVGVRAAMGQHGRSSQAAMGTAGYYPATTPGPPIQTTHHNKGPDGANLFIFHVPNHFTNLDMWHLFCHYGNLLSVRIMVEKDSGRSRGFGFVSYDSPDAAAMAIKELNGFVIGNKRLKVQHKQIRPSDNNNHQALQQDHFQSPPLFPPNVIGQDAPPTGETEDESNGNIHMMRHNWLKDAHNGTAEMPPNYHQSSSVPMDSSQPQQSASVGEAAVGSGSEAPIMDGQSNNNGKLERHFDDGSEQNVGAALSNMNQMRDALPEGTK